jgi:flagellar biosynthetic protein FliR
VYFGLILTRVGTFVAVMPLFADRAPRTVRAGLAVALAVFYFSAVGPRWDAAAAATKANSVLFALSLGREALIGAAMGFAFSMFLLPAQIAGAFVSQQIGLAHGVPGSPVGPPATSPVALAFEVLAALVLLELNGHHVVLSVLHASFAKLPLGGGMIPQPLTPMVDGLARANELGILLASPVALCMIMLTLTLAFLARVAPQLNINSIGFTLQTIVALVSVSVLLPQVAQALVAVFGQSSESVLRISG